MSDAAEEMIHDDEGGPVWQSTIWDYIVEGWSDAEITALCDDLDRAVMLAVADHEARRAMTVGDTEV